MSRRSGAPYDDQIEDEGRSLIYEGHDVARSPNTPNPKEVDQEEFLPSRKLSENGKFKKAVEDAKVGHCPPRAVKVYEKIREGIWSYNGTFELRDCWKQTAKNRQVFKFKLVLVEDMQESHGVSELAHNRIIPSSVKLAVWQRDSGRCVQCASTNNLHFDHIIPFSKGGASITADNIQLLCCRHNLQKRDGIQ